MASNGRDVITSHKQLTAQYYQFTATVIIASSAWTTTVSWHFGRIEQ